MNSPYSSQYFDPQLARQRELCHHLVGLALQNIYGKETKKEPSEDYKRRCAEYMRRFREKREASK